jgi:exonuclease III
MKFVSWNCRGISSPSKIEAEKYLIKMKTSDILMIQETKLEEAQVLTLGKVKWKKKEGATVSERGYSGGIATRAKKIPFSFKTHFQLSIGFLRSCFISQVEPEGEFQEKPLCILDRKETILRIRAITQVKVQWKCFSPNDATSELKEDMLKYYPIIF